MPSFVTVPLLLAVIVAGSAFGLSLLALTAVARIGRHAIGRARGRRDDAARPLVLAAAAGEQASPELLRARGSRGRAVERVAFAYLGRVRGESHYLIADVLLRRGAVDRLVRRSRRPLMGHVRARAAERLGLIASAEAERRLEQMTADDASLAVRVVATRALGKTGAAAAAAALLRSLERPDPVPEGIAASALLELGPEAVPALREALGASDSQEGLRRRVAADLLGFLDDLPSWHALAAAAESGDPGTRVSAARALGRLGVPQASVPLVRCLAPHEPADLRAAAAWALGQIGDPGAAGALASCVGDPDYWVAHTAAAALSLMGPDGGKALTAAARGGAPGARHAREALDRQALTARALPAGSAA